MTFHVKLSDEARETYNRFAAENPSKYNKVRKGLGLTETNLRSPSLETHEYVSIKGPRNEKMFEAYVGKQTTGAYRLFWYYGPEKGVITVAAITPPP
jgi:hypothetical protein